MTEEAELIHRILTGDTESFRFLVERYQRPIISFIRNIIEDNHTSQDIAQDVFFTAYKKLNSFDPACSKFSTWLFTIAKNKSINAVKKKKVQITNKLPEKTDTKGSSENLEKRELFKKIDEALANLPDKQKRAFVLAELENLSYEQIAQIEGTRIGTIKSRINRAKTKLRLALQNTAGDIP